MNGILRRICVGVGMVAIALNGAASHAQTTLEGLVDRDPSMKAILARKMPEVRFNKNGFADVIDFLRDISGANITVDWKVLAKAGIKDTTPVSVRLRGATLEKCLTAVLADV